MENSSGVCCGLEVQIKDNQIVNVRPDKASMRSLGGYCCRKGRAMKYFQHNKTGVELSLMKPVDPLRLSIDQDFSYTAVTGPVAFNRYTTCIATGGPADFLMESLRVLRRIRLFLL